MKNKTNGDSKNIGDVRDMFGFTLFGKSKGVLLNLIESDMVKKRKIWIATVNPEFVMATTKDNEFLNILQSRTTYNVIDGIGLAWARLVESRKSKVERFVYGIKIGVEIMMGRHRENLIAGADLMDDLCRMAEKNGQSVYFLGGWDDRGKKTAEFFLKKYPKLKIAGYYAGKREGEDEKIIKMLAQKKIDYLFVAFAMKTQEEFINRNLEKLNVGLVMGLGRSFDYYSGDLPRAPKWIRNIGFEWLFSLIIEPKRWKRQLALPKFIWMVLKNLPKI